VEKGASAMKRNLTLSLDEEILHKARSVCQKRKTTLTNYVRSQLLSLVKRDDEYRTGMLRMIKLMKKKPITTGNKAWTRADIHER
jgi:hypothetical protein